MRLTRLVSMFVVAWGVAYSADVIEAKRPSKKIQFRTLSEDGVEVRRVRMERVPGLGAVYCEGGSFEEAIKTAPGIERNESVSIVRKTGDTLEFKAESNLQGLMVERAPVLSDGAVRFVYGCTGGAALWALAKTVSSSEVKSSLLAPAVILGGLSARFTSLGELLYPSRPQLLAESVLGAVDRRKEVDQTTEWPWYLHGRIEMEWRRDGRKVLGGSGSGTLIGNKYVITAAHNLYDRRYGLGHSSGYNFVAGLGGNAAGDDCYVGLSSGDGFELHPYYVSPRKQGEERFYDMAIMKLRNDLGASLGTMGFTIFDEAKDKVVSVTGYPGEYANSMRMYTMTGPVVQVDAEQIHYNIDTSAGQSGSGVYSVRGGNQYCVAVHAYGGGPYNSATRLTKEKFDLVKKWMADK